MKNIKNSRIKRRQFLQSGLKTAAGITLGGIGGFAISKSRPEDTVWQIDPYVCVQCEKCAENCVLSQSAVKCVHAYAMCGYCDLCSGYLRPDHKARDTGAESQLCPTAAIRRTFVEDPYFQYKIDEPLCIGCGKCVKGCNSFGNGSLYLQIRHDLCKNCNDCSIANSCPSGAIKRVSARKPYFIKGKK